MRNKILILFLLLFIASVIQVSAQEQPQKFLAAGDFNKDGKVDLSDGVGILRFLFLGGSAGCDFAGDVNNGLERTINAGNINQILARLAE